MDFPVVRTFIIFYCLSTQSFTRLLTTPVLLGYSDFLPGRPVPTRPPWPVVLREPRLVSHTARLGLPQGKRLPRTGRLLYHDTDDVSTDPVLDSLAL